MADRTGVLDRAAAARVAEWAARHGLARKAAVGLAIASLASALVTYAALTGSLPYGSDARSVLVLLNLDLVLFLALGAIVARRLVALWLERRRGSVGSRLHTRLVVWFSLIALVPAIIVSLFSALFFSLGVQSWFSDRVRTALDEATLVAESYLHEHQQVIRGDVLAMARDINRAAPQLWTDPAAFSRLVAAQAMLRNLSEAYVFDGSGRMLARWNLSFVLDHDPVPPWAIEKARDGEVVVLAGASEDRLRAIVKLDGMSDAFLYIGRFVEPRVLDYINRTKQAVAQYKSLEGQRSTIEVTFAMMFVLVALLLLMAAIWVGLTFATRLVRPISALAFAAERVRGGDLATRVTDDGDDEIASLSRAFNRMTGQLETQRRELLEANRQLDARRHFIETVMSGVSAGVIGLDAEGRITLANRSASELVSLDLVSRIGRDLHEVVPEMGVLLDKARQPGVRLAEAQVGLERDRSARTLFARIVADVEDDAVIGFVVTFDDISELLAAQRKAAWSDVARRIAHEIKNPLTPIQLSAERLRKKYMGEIRSDPNTFDACTETIIRHVGDIGRMVDEFSAFARMPTAVIVPGDLVEVCRRALSLQRGAHPEVEFVADLPDGRVEAPSDAALVGQALTNLLKNAVEAIEGRKRTGNKRLPRGRVALAIDHTDEAVVISITDNGRGLPPTARERLTEPYVTTREKGTGLGLAIVKKIMEDHHGALELDDGPDGGATVRLVFPRGAEAAAGGGAGGGVLETPIDAA